MKRSSVATWLSTSGGVETLLESSASFPLLIFSLPGDWPDRQPADEKSEDIAGRPAVGAIQFPFRGLRMNERLEPWGLSIR